MGNGRVEFLCHDSIFFNKSLRSITGHLRAGPSSLCIEQVIIIGAAFMIVSAIPFKLRNQSLCVNSFAFSRNAIFICRANIRSAEATREQVAEARRQYEEEHRPYISYQFIFERRAFYGMRFMTGKAL